MPVDSALIVLACLGVTIIALAVSGLIRQLRVLEGTVRVLAAQRTSRMTRSAAIPRGDLDESSATAFVFVEEGCPSCEDVLRELPHVAGGIEGALALVIVPSHGMVTVEIDGVRAARDPEAIRDALSVPVVPFVVVVGANGEVIAESPLSPTLKLQMFVDSLEMGVRKEIARAESERS